MKKGMGSMVRGALAALAVLAVGWWWWKSPRQVVNRVFKYEFGRAPTDPGDYTNWETYLKTQGTELKLATYAHTGFQEAKDYRAGKYASSRAPYPNHYGLGA